MRACHRVVSGEELVEGLLPGGRVERRACGEHSVEIEDARLDRRAEPEERSGRARTLHVPMEMRVR